MSNLAPEWQNANFPNVLTPDRYINIEDLIERVCSALHEHKSFGLVRWGDGENEILEKGSEGPGVYQYVANRLTLAHYGAFRHRFIAGISKASVLGMHVNDWWTCRVLHNARISIADKPLVYAWANRHWSARREWCDYVLGKPWRTVLFGNRMREYEPWLKQRCPGLNIVGNFGASDYPEVDAGCAQFAELKPELILASVGWYAPMVVEAGMTACGAVVIDYGHCPDYHLSGYMAPNTCCPKGVSGCAEHYRHGNYPDCIPQSREIVLL